MICEYCKQVHEGQYGSGRFCNKKCASGFSSFEKRAEINAKVSQSLKGRQGHPMTSEQVEKRKQTLKSKYGTTNSFSIHSRDQSATDKMKQTIHKRIETMLLNTPFDQLGKIHRRVIVFREQNGQCLSCDHSTWLNKPIPLELDHIDGNRKDNSRTNLRLLCPNCHALTPTYRGKNIKSRSSTINNEDFIKALKSNTNIRTALKSLNIAAYGGNYERAKKLVAQHQILFQ